MMLDKLKENELFKYTIVGLLSTVIQYLTYAVCFRLTGNYYFANVMGFVISVFNSYYWNRHIVFHSNHHTVWWKVLLKSYIIYFGTGVVATNILSYVMIELLQISPYISPLIIVFILYPFNYLINKYWANKREVK